MTGRPSKFKPEFVTQAEKLCRFGATNPELADFFEVGITTLERWASENEAFRGALKAGKAEADSRVERSLFQRAVGYQTESVKIFMPAGATEPVYAPYRENIQPDTTAAIFWLKNRKPAEWRDRHETKIDGSLTIAGVEVAFVKPGD